MTAVGPLTTTFRAPSSCTTTTPQLYQIQSGTDSSYVEGPLFTLGSDCFPSAYDPAPANYYSPGWCPYGYTSACSSLASVSAATETAVICCPTNFNYTCLASATLGQPSLGCTTTWTAALAVLGVTVVTDGKIGTATVVSETANGITAFGIQVRFQSGDPTPAPKTDDSGLSVVTKTSPPPIPVPTQTSSPSPGGVSTRAAIGIGVGSAVAALLLASAIGLFFFLRWRRKKRSSSSQDHQPSRPPSSQPPPVPLKDPYMVQKPSRTVSPLYELPDDTRPSRRPSMSVSKRHLSMSPVMESAQFRRTAGRGDSEVLVGYLAAELAAPSEPPSLRDRASPESHSSGWTDRQARGGTMPMRWL